MGGLIKDYRLTIQGILIKIFGGNNWGGAALVNV
jgi:hypothetical protein